MRHTTKKCKQSDSLKHDAVTKNLFYLSKVSVLPQENDPILYWLCYGALFISCIHLPVIIYNRLVR